MELTEFSLGGVFRSVEGELKSNTFVCWGGGWGVLLRFYMLELIIFNVFLS